MDLQILAGLLLTVGGGVGIAATLLPISIVYRTKNVQERAAILETRRKEYTNQNMMFLASELLIGIGLVLVSLLLAENGARSMGWLAAGISVPGTIFMAWVTVGRNNNTDGKTFLPERLYWIYSPSIYLSHAALLVYGIAYLQTELVVNWVAWVHILGMSMVLGFYITIKNVPPQIYMLVSMLAGIYLL